MRAALAGGLLALVLVSGCATAPPMLPPDQRESAWQRHLDRIARIDGWDLDGRMSIRTPDEGGRLGVLWRQDRERYELRLTAQFGQGVMQITGDERLVRLTLPDGRILEERTAEMLLRRQFGWEVPVGTLRYWVLGMPSPGSEESHELDAQGRLATLEQSGWRVSFEDYTRVEGMDLPRKLFLYGDGLEVRLVIDQWRGLIV